MHSSTVSTHGREKKQNTIHCPAQARIPCPTAPSGSRRRPAPPCTGWGKSRDPLRRPQKGAQARRPTLPRHRPDPADRLMRTCHEMAGTSPRRRTDQRRFEHYDVALAAPPGCGCVGFTWRMQFSGIIQAPRACDPGSTPGMRIARPSRARGVRFGRPPHDRPIDRCMDRLCRN